MADVLVVDDDPDIRLLVTFALEEAGFFVHQASDGEKALAALDERAFDAVVLDVMMPHVDGFSVLRGMRERSSNLGARVIMLTCKTEERDHVRGWQLGAHAYLTKPFDPEDLVACLHALMAATPAELRQRRESELQKAKLLNRLEAAFERPGHLSEPSWDLQIPR